MKFIVHELAKARADKRRIFRWLLQRSPNGAAAWLEAYDRMLARLIADADRLSTAEESRDLESEVRHILFKTKRGRVYRAIYQITGSDVYVLRVRGPGQAPISPEDLAD